MCALPKARGNQGAVGFCSATVGHTIKATEDHCQDALRSGLIYECGVACWH